MTKRALLQRLNRHLAKEDKKLCATRASSRGYNDLGDFHEISVSRNIVTATHVDLEKWSREAGVLKPYEYVTD